MQALVILAIVALVIALIIAIVVWTIVFIECKKIRKQRRIDRLIERIRFREEDSGNESEGDTDDLAQLIGMGNYGLGDDNNL
uniref:Protein Vpu n=1 Tax=Human immunodeficiency virus type 1 TaxID=11676 RepID=A0A6B9SFF7_HV1|nr:vpu protein [Human immunodeficiency virus 1]